MTKHAISPLRSENYPEWYQQVVKAADLAETSDVRGCMIIKPWGYALWESIQKILDIKFKNLGMQNAYFPLFIPLKFLEKEASHVEGFAKECAVVTHSRLQADENGKLVPVAPLEEPLIVRPTSETIIGESFAKWIQSYRDLPIKINQWANVVRWEMRTRLFLRTAEFLWQEGHTAHATAEEAEIQANTMLQCYKQFAENDLAVPVFIGQKTDMEKFPGAEKTFCIEMMMQDGKALQAGTSHFLGQNFAKSAEIQFTSENGNLEYAWTTSFGVTTRLIGALIMVHSDDDGFIAPPRIVSQQIIILPVIHKDKDRENILHYCNKLREELSMQSAFGDKIRCNVDTRDLNGGIKKWEWIKKGVPLILEIGPRDIESDSIFYTERYSMEKYNHSRVEFVATIGTKLEEIQKKMYHRALKFRDDHTKEIYSKDELFEFFESNAGFAITYFKENQSIETEIKERFNVTIRCILPAEQDKVGKCIFSGADTQYRVIWAKAY